eukprot:15474273-Alexandrium_andersonii.AAC.1
MPPPRRLRPLRGAVYLAAQLWWGGLPHELVIGDGQEMPPGKKQKRFFPAKGGHRRAAHSASSRCSFPSPF